MTTSTLTQFDFATEEQVLDIFDDQLDAIAGGLAITVQESGMDGFVTPRPLMHEL
mgnify:FL=1|tara:strand:+ start:337 stop:501 length:165 start_codon:yes stop_codon:yes gene_type:complete